jgi:DNA polymerase
MSHIYLDFETRSKCDLKVHGVPLYAADPSTLPLMLAYGREGDWKQWYFFRDGNLIPQELNDYALDPEVEFHAYNAPFEMYVWDRICVARWGWPSVPTERWVCTMAKAAHANQPQFLDGLLKRIKLDEKYHKDAKGKSLIKILSVPTKLQTKYERNILGEDGKPLKVLDDEGNPTRRNQKEINRQSKQYAQEIGADVFTLDAKPGEYFFREDHDLMEEFLEYNVQDIVAEEAADVVLPPISDEERETWILDRKVNQFGIPIDRGLCEAAVKLNDQEVEFAIERLERITGGEVTSGGQVARIKSFVEDRCDTDLFEEGLKSVQVNAFLARYEDHPERWGELNHKEAHVADAIEVLQIRKLVGGAAVKKYKAALNYADADERCREQVRYYRASTGRWGGQGLQPHNFKRTKTPDEEAFEAICTGDWELVTMYAGLCGTTLPGLLTDCLRGLIIAPEGKTFVVSDFAGIEGRVLNWLVGNEYKLDLYRKGEDTYIHAALPVYGVKFEDITFWNEDKKKFVIKPEFAYMRQMGKAQELGLGYGMAWRTFRNGAIRAGQDMEEDFAQMVVKTWRETNPEVPQFWWDIEAACIKVVQAGRRHNRQVATHEGKVAVGYDPKRKNLIIRLPSGRNLFYYDPVVKKEEDQFGRMKDNLYYYDGKKGYTNTYGGKLTENIVQALARDLLVYSMKIIDAADIPIAFHVHDEVVAEVEEALYKVDYDVVHKAMETLPPWATGLPLEAETYVSRRYRK